MKINFYVATAAGVVISIMAELLGSGEPRYVLDEEWPAPDSGEQEALRPAAVSQLRQMHDSDVIGHDHPHPEDTRLSEAEMAACAASGPPGDSGAAMQLYTLTLKRFSPTIMVHPPLPPIIDKIGQPLSSSPEAAPWLYGAESDLDRLKDDLANVLRLAPGQAEAIMGQLQKTGEVTVGNDVADDASILQKFARKDDQSKFSLAIVAVPDSSEAGAFQDLPARGTPAAQDGNPPIFGTRRISGDRLFPEEHPVRLLRHFTASELARFGMRPRAPMFVSPRVFWPSIGNTK
jgi:hypothetical protein